MIREVILAVIQGVTEFLPVSSSGHLALFSNLISEPNLFFFVMLHIASLLAVIIYFRKDIWELRKVREKSKYWSYIIIGIIPAALFGYFFSDWIEAAISNYFFIGGAFILTGIVLFSTKFFRGRRKIGLKESILVGIMQILALFPGVSRSGITTSTAMWNKVDGEKAGKFSFLIFIPLAIGAMIVEFGEFYFSWDLLVAFIVCFFVSLFCLNLFFRIIKRNKFWLFSIYLFVVGIMSIILGVLR
jgi:undecaprenyl-diphosphatase